MKNIFICRVVWFMLLFTKRKKNWPASCNICGNLHKLKLKEI